MVNLFASEEILNPSKRCYKRIDNFSQNGNNYIFRYKPYHKSERAIFFATVYYQSGIHLSPNIKVVEFTENEVKELPSNPVLYSSRDIGSENIFISFKDKDVENIISLNNEIQIKNGTQGIKGISTSGGIITYSVLTKKHKPNKDNILMFDFHNEEDRDKEYLLFQERHKMFY